MIQPRDLAIARFVGEAAVADREQIRVACGFGSTTRVNARLLALTNAGVLRRFFLGFGAGRKAVYSLSKKGARLVDTPLRGPRRRQNETLVADYGVDHQLAVNDLRCALAFRPLSVPGVTFRRWLAFHETVAPSIRLIPDGYVELETPSGVLAAFLEVDLGHEHTSIWKEKTRQYLQLAVTGDYAHHFGPPRFRVLVLATSPRRLQTIRHAVGTLTEKIFWFATLEAARRDFFGSVWLRPVGDRPQPFIEQIL
jgi:hypothetical protein